MWPCFYFYALFSEQSSQATFKVWVTMPFWLYPRSPSAPAAPTDTANSSCETSGLQRKLFAGQPCYVLSGRSRGHADLTRSRSSHPSRQAKKIIILVPVLSATPRLHLLERDSLQGSRINEPKEKGVARWTLAFADQAWGKQLLSPAKSSGPSALAREDSSVTGIPGSVNALTRA